MQRLAALVPRARLHLIRFHGVLANAKLRSQVAPAPAQRTTAGEGDCQHAHSKPARMTVETQSCMIATKRDSTFYPGDVNSPPWENVYVIVDGKRRDGTASIRVSFHVGDRQMSLAVGGSSAVRNRIRAQFFRAFC